MATHSPTHSLPTCYGERAGTSMHACAGSKAEAQTIMSRGQQQISNPVGARRTRDEQAAPPPVSQTASMSRRAGRRAEPRDSRAAHSAAKEQGGAQSRKRAHVHGFDAGGEQPQSCTVANEHYL